METEILNLNILCQSFPKQPSLEIWRDNILATIDTIFLGDIQVIFIDGPPGVGKTTLISQFARKHSNNAICLFVKPSTRWGFDPNILKVDLCGQILWAVSNEELKDFSLANDTFLGNLIMKLARTARIEHKTFYFIVDGLDDIPTEHAKTRDLILDLLPPPGMQGFKFIFAGDNYTFPKTFQDKAHKTLPLAPFSIGETEQYLKDISTDNKVIDELHHISKGMPGNLASIRRIIYNGNKIEDVLSMLPEHLQELYEIEWKSVINYKKEDCLLLAIIAHDTRRHNVSDLCIYVKCPEPTIIEKVQRYSFLIFNKDDSTISYISENFRRFASQKLNNYKEQVDNILIEYLLQDPDGIISIEALPDYFQRAGRKDDILEYLSPARLQLLIQKSQSCIPIQQKAELGITAAKSLKRDNEQLRFSHFRSCIAEVNAAERLRPEIEARLALGDYQSALSIAHSTVLKEDRLHLLAIIARELQMQSRSIPSELKDQLTQLYTQVDFKQLGARVIDIACDVFFANPSLAIEMIDKAQISTNGGVDWAFATLSIVALLHQEDRREENIEQIRQRIKDPKARDLSRSAQSLLMHYSASKVLAEAEKIDRLSDRLYFLRQWTLANARASDAVDVVRYALNLIIQTSESTPDARAFREIATPLPYITSISAKYELISKFDSQRTIIQKLGPTDDYIRLLLTLARSEYGDDHNAALDRFEEIYLEIGDIKDISIKALSLARLAMILKEVDPNMEYERKGNFHSLVKNERNKEIERILVATGEHYTATKYIIRILARTEIADAVALAAKLNLQSRRDQAYNDIIETLSKRTLSKSSLVALRDILNKFSDKDIRDNALLTVFKNIVETEAATINLEDDLLMIIGCIQDVRDAGIRAEACSLGMLILDKNGNLNCKEEIKNLERQMKESWDAIDIGWTKVDLGFKLVKLLAKTMPNIGNVFLKNTERIRESNEVSGAGSGTALIASLRLLVRAFNGLTNKNLYTESDISRIELLINKIPSSVLRCYLWTDLTLILFAAKHKDVAAGIVSKKIRPLFQAFDSRDIRCRDAAIIYAAPALFSNHPATALDIIKSLQDIDRDTALMNIATFILRKCSPMEPYDESRHQAYRISYEEAIDICSVMEFIEDDSDIYFLIKALADTLTSKAHEARFNRNERSEIVHKLHTLVNKKLPAQKFIAHDGYKIIAKAQIARIDKFHPHAWLTFAEDIRNLPNVADQIYCLTTFSDILPPKEDQLRQSLLKEASSLLKSIPIDSDRISHCEELASVAAQNNPALMKQLLEQAAKECLTSSEENLGDLQKRIIDIAYQHNPDLASSLASAFDDDPARRKNNENIASGHLRLLKLRKEIAKEDDPELMKNLNRGECSKAAWDLLGGLNSGRTTHCSPDKIREYIQIASSLPLSESYPIFSWIIQNAVNRFSETGEAQTVLRPLFEMMMLNSELAVWLSSYATTQTCIANKPNDKSTIANSVLIEADHHDEALRWISNWIRQHSPSYIKICDPYFSIDALDLLKAIRMESSDCEVLILTNKRQQDSRSGISLDNLFRTHWRTNISDQDPGPTSLIFVTGKDSGKFPIHDRWLLAQNVGLRLGTSASSLGIFRVSEISELTEIEVQEREKEVDKYLYFRERQYMGERLEYASFDL